MTDRKEKQSRIDVFLTESHIKKAKQIGNGNMSEGIREALESASTVAIIERDDGLFLANYYYEGIGPDDDEWGTPDGWATGMPGESRTDFEARCKRTWPGCAIIEAEDVEL